MSKGENVGYQPNSFVCSVFRSHFLNGHGKARLFDKGLRGPNKEKCFNSLILIPVCLCHCSIGKRQNVKNSIPRNVDSFLEQHKMAAVCSMCLC